MCITNIEQAIEFVLNWMNLRAQASVNLKLLPSTAPRSIRSLDRSLGHFWELPPYQVGARIGDTNTRSLFDIQDVILNPHEQYAQCGITALLVENQGVCEFGYNSQQELMLRGEWTHDLSSKEWVTFPAEIEDLLIWALLSNLFWYMMTDEYLQSVTSNNAVRPEGVEELLWAHPAWGDLGFWSNPENDVLYYHPNGVVSKV